MADRGTRKHLGSQYCWTESWSHGCVTHRCDSSQSRALVIRLLYSGCFTWTQYESVLSQVWHHVPIIPDIQEPDIGGLQVQYQPGQVGEILSQNLKGGQRRCSAVEHLGSTFPAGKIQTAQYRQKKRHKLVKWKAESPGVDSSNIVFSKSHIMCDSSYIKFWRQGNSRSR